ncbi:hypothetical protein ACP275_11G107100 [Erythranthe tilingii]
MKLKIVHQSQENRAAEEEPIKNETMEIDQIETHKIRVLVEDDENPSPINPPPISAYDPMLVSGKRKRKPKEMIDEAPSVFRRRRKFSSSSSSSKCKDATLDSGGTSMSMGGPHSKSPTMIRAEEVQSSLGNDHPSFLKFLVRSHVGSCFWMGLPVPFCKLHLPFKDTIVTLENENGEEFPIKYIAHKTGLSAGWRKFVGGNKLLEGDVLIFHLIEPCRLKVYVIRANDLTEVDGALSLLILDSQTKQSDAEMTIDAQINKRRRQKSLPLTIVQMNNETQLETSGNESEEVASEVLEGSKSSSHAPNFNDVSCFEEFHVIVNGISIDSEIPEHIRRKYYDLCSTKNVFLHDCLLPGLYVKLAGGIIVETVNIVDAIRGCELTTPKEEFEVWEKSLRSFELLGLNVGFLRAHLRRLLSMAFDSEGALETRRYWAALMDRNRAEDEIENLEAKISELKELSAKCDRDIENLKTRAESYEVMFQEEVSASW